MAFIVVDYTDVVKLRRPYPKGVVGVRTGQPKIVVLEKRPPESQNWEPDSNGKCRIFVEAYRCYMVRKLALEARMARRIKRMESTVLMRSDFDDLGGYDQVGRVLRRLTTKGELVKIGYGLYAKAERSPITGAVIPLRSLPALAKEALGRLQVQTVPSQLERDYNSGRSTQVPTGRLIGVTSRINRKIGYNGNYVSFEYAGGEAGC